MANNNARQTPKLADWALVDIRDGDNTQAPGVIKFAGFYNERWQPLGSADRQP